MNNHPPPPRGGAYFGPSDGNSVTPVFLLPENLDTVSEGYYSFTFFIHFMQPAAFIPSMYYTSSSYACPFFVNVCSLE
jgi:hypothetical protein